MKKEFIVSTKLFRNEKFYIASVIADNAAEAAKTVMEAGYNVVVYNKRLDTIKIKYSDNDSYYIFPAA